MSEMSSVSSTRCARGSSEVRSLAWLLALDRTEDVSSKSSE